MQQCAGTRATKEDMMELKQNIDNAHAQGEFGDGRVAPEVMKWNNELRRLRRMRDAVL